LGTFQVLYVYVCTQRVEEYSDSQCSWASGMKPHFNLVCNIVISHYEATPPPLPFHSLLLPSLLPPLLFPLHLLLPLPSSLPLPPPPPPSPITSSLPTLTSSSETCCCRPACSSSVAECCLLSACSCVMQAKTRAMN